ncbi:MAG: hypothetical protein LAN36_05070 [Acidobacteriia bacterium]|nr:hypothetical protein [Terriglobia bacterium]
MTAREHSRKPRNKSRQAIPTAYLEYYQSAFALFHRELARSGYDPKEPHEVAGAFWSIVPPGTYDPDSARSIIRQYLSVVEQRLASLLSRHCIGYWLHAYRRLFPGSIGYDSSEATVLLVRGALEAAIQKYAQREACNGVGFSNEIDTKDVFNGLLLAPEFEGLRKGLQISPQFVLTKFDVQSLRELYDCEKLGFEIWRCGATLRILGKGARLRVDPTNSRYFGDERTDELDTLVSKYDSRQGYWAASASGTVFSREFATAEHMKGGVILPTYNVGNIPAKEFNEFFKSFNLKMAESSRLNFAWVPLNFPSYYHAHEPLAGAFASHVGIRLEWLMAVINALSLRVVHCWNEDRSYLLRTWQRGYEGPYAKDYVEREIRHFLPFSVKALKLPVDAGDIDVLATIGYLELREDKRARIDPSTAGPHFVFLPHGDRLFIDYAWIHRLLHNLFYGVQLDDQNFKGDALEIAVRAGHSALPIGPCKALSGEQRQIDAAFIRGDTLVIAECRAFAYSFGIERGDPIAIRYRTQKLEKALNDIDHKARWLAGNPRGTNYDIRKMRRIIPIAVTPFVEFIPSTHSHYWLSEQLPRVLTPFELRQALSENTIEKIAEYSPNEVRIPSES